jgi:hypothetical protein
LKQIYEATVYSKFSGLIVDVLMHQAKGQVIGAEEKLSITTT